MDTLYHLQKTPYGGRGLFSIQPIPKDTLLHTCASPYAAVILRVFRKEVCGQCFAYAFDANRNAWNIKSEAQDGHSVWFCGVSCRDVWAAEQDIGGLLGLMNAAVEKLVKRMKKPKEGDKLPPKHILRPENVTLETLDLAWKAAERINTKPGSDPVWLNELELNTARFVISGIVRRYLEDTMQTPRSDGALSWSELLALQNNEAQHIRSHPHILESQLRVYTFLRRVVVPVLQPYIETSETVRAILARDHGNVFGMWDMSATGDSEMLGWSMYVSASYFNHGQFTHLLTLPMGLEHRLLFELLRLLS